MMNIQKWCPCSFKTYTSLAQAASSLQSHGGVAVTARMLRASMAVRRSLQQARARL